MRVKRKSAGLLYYVFGSATVCHGFGVALSGGVPENFTVVSTTRTLKFGSVTVENEVVVPVTLVAAYWVATMGTVLHIWVPNWLLLWLVVSSVRCCIVGCHDTHGGIDATHYNVWIANQHN